MKEKSNIDLLFKKQIDGNITVDERIQLKYLLEKEENQKYFDELLFTYFSEESVSRTEFERVTKIKEAAWQSINLHISQQSIAKASRTLPAWFKIAASLLLVASATLYYIVSQKEEVKTTVNLAASVKPGTNRAVLSSSNGAVYKLSGEKGEVIFDHNHIHYKDGVVIAEEAGDEVLTLSTPRGGQYRVTLSDGTKVWLNAASSISYPNEFKGIERKVTLSGEAFFEVSHNAEKPFIVATKNQNVKVLGTSFNINAYGDENQTITTLTTGSVQLQSGTGTNIAKLKPGQQAVFDKNAFDITEVDVTVFDAWKEGYFRFKATSLIEAMRQIDRWYDLNVDYTNMPKDVYIHASINRNRPLTSVIDALEKVTNLKFDINGRSVKLMK